MIPGKQWSFRRIDAFCNRKFIILLVKGIYSESIYRAGGTGLAAPVLAGPIFQAPTIFFN